MSDKQSNDNNNTEILLIITVASCRNWAMSVLISTSFFSMWSYIRRANQIRESRSELKKRVLTFVKYCIYYHSHAATESPDLQKYKYFQIYLKPEICQEKSLHRIFPNVYIYCWKRDVLIILLISSQKLSYQTITYTLIMYIGKQFSRHVGIICNHRYLNYILYINISI